jgi:hypothetical protein
MYRALWALPSGKTHQTKTDEYLGTQSVSLGVLRTLFAICHLRLAWPRICQPSPLVAGHSAVLGY